MDNRLSLNVLRIIAEEANAPPVILSRLSRRALVLDELHQEQLKRARRRLEDSELSSISRLKRLYGDASNVDSSSFNVAPSDTTS